VHKRVAVDLARRREQEARAVVLRQAERVVGAVGADLERMQGQPRIVDRAGGRGHVVDEVDGLVDLVMRGDVEHLEAEVRPVLEVPDVLQRSRLEVVDADHPVSAVEQVVAQMRPKEAGSAGDERGWHRSRGYLWLPINGRSRS
jgi:hypothetical protein